MRSDRSGDTDNILMPGSASWYRRERQIKAFEDAWQAGSEPAIEGFLSPESDRLALLIELVHVDLEYRFKHGREARSEQYFERFPELRSDSKIAVELLASECMLRQRHGGDCSVDDLRARFPDFADALVSELRLDRATVLGPVRLDPLLSRNPPPVVPGYEILAELGHGGMGVVYQARDVLLDRLVALKFLPGAYSRDSDRLDRFAREARTASALNHPHICTIHALGEHDGRPFIVMEYIEGVTLESMVGEQVALAPLTGWIGQAARALAVAHVAGVVHRDVKPANLMVRADGYVKVLDFGLARRLPTIAPAQTTITPDTDPGVFMGTAAYASPEQARGEPASSESDVFSLGIVLYELATGRHPFGGDSALAMLRAINSHRPVPPSRINPEIPLALEGLIDGMLSKEPKLRPTAAEVVAALGALATVAPQRTANMEHHRSIVHREPELTALSKALADAEAGCGSIVALIAEPGMGKTTLVEDFLDRLAHPPGAYLVIRGRCSERLAGTEAYLPVIDGLGDLVRADNNSAVTRLLNAVAPTWYAQAAPTTAHRMRTQDAQANSQRAVLREFDAFLREAGRLNPVVLFFDDVHWADLSTVDLLAHLGRHVPTLRLLVIVTFRPTEMFLGPHPFHRVHLELQSQGVCSELPLGLLSRMQIDRYLSLAFADHALSEDFAQLIFSQTEGIPLFMVELLRYLRERGVIAQVDGRWSLASDVPDLRNDLPASVRGMIRRKLERLGEQDHRLLSAASVQGHEFDSTLVASVTNLDSATVEDRLQVLERVHGLVRLIREHEFPDRNLTLRYAFVHVLYQQALYANLSATRRASLSLALAEALASHQTEGSHAAAAELACLYEVGRDFAQAAQYLWLAAQNAARVCADRKAVVLARRGLAQLEHVPRSPERSALELSLQMILGMQLQVTEGYAAPAAHAAYTRARELCDETGTAPPFPVLWGLWLFSKVRSDLDRARELADELRIQSQQKSDAAFALQAQQAQTVTALCRGEPAAALRHMEHGALLYDPLRHRSHSVQFGQDPDVACRAFGAVALWILGGSEQALRMSDDAVARSHELQHPSTQALALHFAAMLHQLRRDPVGSRSCSDVSGSIAAEHGLSFWAAGATVLNGWALAELGMAEGVAKIRAGLADWLATGSITYQTYYLGLLAETLGKRGEIDAALRTVDEALNLTLRTGEGLYLAELHRLRGEWLLLAAEGDASSITWERIEQEFRSAVDIAQRQEANAFKLRATLSLAQLQRRRGDSGDARTLLEQTLRSFAEGHHTPDLVEAHLFLEGDTRD
jgi:serine/threonine protein kinase/predicted ATPase